MFLLSDLKKIVKHMEENGIKSFWISTVLNGSVIETARGPRSPIASFECDNCSLYSLNTAYIDDTSSKRLFYSSAKVTTTKELD